MRSSTLPWHGSLQVIAAGLLISSLATGQDKPPAAVAATPAPGSKVGASASSDSAGALESVPAKVAEFEKNLADKIDATRTVLDREVAEKRLAESVAQTLRWSLRTSAIAFSGTDIRGVLATARVPFENEVVTKALRELEATWVTIQAEYGDLQKAALADARKRAIELIKNGQSSEQIDAFIPVLEAAQTVLQRRFAGATGPDPNTTLNGILTGMRSLRRFVEAAATGNVRAVSSAISSTQIYGMDSQGEIDAEMRMRFEKARAPYLAKMEQAQAALDGALKARKPSEEVATLLNAYTDATEQANQLRANYDYNSNRDYTASIAGYRAAIGILAMIEQKDYASALHQIRTGSGLSAEGERTSKVVPLLRSWQNELEVQLTKSVKEQTASWRLRITNAKGPGDLEEVGREAGVVEQMPRDERRRATDPVPYGLSQTLMTLATAWRTASPTLLRENRVQPGEPGRGESFAAELTALRRRIERDVISRTLKAPELNQPPLAEKEPAEAIEELCEQLAAKKEWRRLVEVRQAWLMTSPADGYGRADDLLSALRSYLAGQNFELAEQWVDAAAAYKRVLLSTSARAPIADAAERLKVLKKEHPETANAPAPQRPPGREAFEQ